MENGLGQVFSERGENVISQTPCDCNMKTFMLLSKCKVQ